MLGLDVDDRPIVALGVGTTGWRVGGARPGEPRRGTKDSQWRPALKALSPAYTTKWNELLRVR